MDTEARLSRWGGHAALGAVVAMVVGIASLVVPTGGQTYRFRDAAGSLAFAADHQVLMAWFLWLGVLGFALLGVTVLGLHARLCQASIPVIVAAASAIIGLVFWVIWCVRQRSYRLASAPGGRGGPVSRRPSSLAWEAPLASGWWRGSWSSWWVGSDSWCGLWRWG